MSNLNCGRLSVTLGDGWREYAPKPPDGWTMLGTVHRKRGHVGALVRSPQDELFCMRGASVERWFKTVPKRRWPARSPMLRP